MRATKVSGLRHPSNKILCFCENFARLEPALSECNESNGVDGKICAYSRRATQRCSRKVWLIRKRLAILGNFLRPNDGGKNVSLNLVHCCWSPNQTSFISKQVCCVTEQIYTAPL
jgi:hypothetical protein